MNPNDPRANRSRKALLDAGVALLTENTDASLTQIADKAGVGRATLYRHFKTREDLINELVRESLQMTESVVEPLQLEQQTGHDAITMIVKAVMPLADRYHFLLSLWHFSENNPEINAVYQAQLGKLAGHVARARSEGTIHPNLTDDWIVACIDSHLYMGWWMVRNMGISVDSATEQALISLFQGINHP